MRPFTLAVGLAVMAAAATPAVAQNAPRYESPMIAHVLPIAAGALVGTASTFFILPLIIPAMAATVPAAGPAVASPLIGAVGGVVGGFVGYAMFRETP